MFDFQPLQFSPTSLRNVCLSEKKKYCHLLVGIKLNNIIKTGNTVNN